MHILIAEDDATSRLMLEKTLQRLGYDVTATCDGNEAWRALQQHRCPIVITDWMMPEMDGPTLCRKIRSDREWNHYTYLMILTSLSGKNPYLEGMTAGADDFMTKPYDADELVARLRVAERILDLEIGAAHLDSLLPACGRCHRVRTSAGQWKPLARYLVEHPTHNAPRSHCPDCTRDRPIDRSTELRPTPYR